MAGQPPNQGILIPICPVCRGRMELVYDRPATKVFVCVDCHSSVTVPPRAWDVARMRGLGPRQDP